MASRGDWVVERVELAVVPQQLRQAPEIEQVLVGKPGKLVKHGGVRLIGVLDEVIVEEYSEETFTGVMETLPRLPNQDLLDFGRLGELLGYDRKLNTLDFPVTPRGYRILGRIPRLPETIVQNVVREFGTFDVMLAATSGELEAVEGVGEVRAKEIREGLRRLQEINLVDRYLQT